MGAGKRDKRSERVGANERASGASALSLVLGSMYDRAAGRQSPGTYLATLVRVGALCVPLGSGLVGVR